MESKLKQFETVKVTRETIVRLLAKNAEFPSSTDLETRAEMLFNDIKCETI